MKKINIENGEIRIGYSFNEVASDIQNKILWDFANFEAEVMNENSPYYEKALEMERMKTPWFLSEVIRFDCEESLIETILINEYLFSPDGEILPIMYYYKNNQLHETTIRLYGKDYNCVIN